MWIYGNSILIESTSSTTFASFCFKVSTLLLWQHGFSLTSWTLTWMRAAMKGQGSLQWSRHISIRTSDAKSRRSARMGGRGSAVRTGCKDRQRKGRCRGCGAGLCLHGCLCGKGTRGLRKRAPIAVHLPDAPIGGGRHRPAQFPLFSAHPADSNTSHQHWGPWAGEMQSGPSSPTPLVPFPNPRSPP